MFRDMGGEEEGGVIWCAAGGGGPISTALMADLVVRMAIFSLGISGVL